MRQDGRQALWQNEQAIRCADKQACRRLQMSRRAGGQIKRRAGEQMSRTCMRAVETGGQAGR